MKRRDHVLEWQKVEEHVNPRGELEANKYAEHQSCLFFVGVERKEMKQVGEKLEKPEVNAEHN